MALRTTGGYADGTILGAGSITPNGQPYILVASSTAPSRITDIADYVCDNIADDVQIQAALDDLTTLGKGGIVVLSQGTYTLTAGTGITLDASNTEFSGSGRGTLIQASTMSGIAFFSNFDTTTRFRCYLHDFRISSITDESGIAIDLSHFRNCSVERVVSAKTNIGIDCNANDTFYNVVNDCVMDVGGAGSMCYRTDNTANFNSFTDIQSVGDSATIGFFCGASGTLVHGYDAEGSMLIAFEFDTAGDGSSLSGFWIENTTTGIQADSGVQAVTAIGGVVKLCTNNITNNAGNEFTWDLELEDVHDAHHSVNKFNLGAEVSGEINGNGEGAGILTYLGANMKIVGEGSASDTLTNIIGGKEGDILIWHAQASAWVITVTNAAGGDGEIRMASPAIITSSFREQYMFKCVGAAGSTKWYEISRGIVV